MVSEGGEADLLVQRGGVENRGAGLGDFEGEDGFCRGFRGGVRCVAEGDVAALDHEAGD